MSSTLVARTLARAATSGHTAAISGSVSGVTEWNPATTAHASSSGDRRSRTSSEVMAVARSATSQLRTTSPKSMTPLGVSRPAASLVATTL